MTKRLLIAGFAVVMTVIAALPARAAGTIRLGPKVEATAVALAPGATKREKLAAKELVDYLAQVTGKQLKRVEIAGSTVPQGTIAVGSLAKDAKLVSQQELDAVARDGYVLKVADGRAAVCGARDLGTLYGAYGLLRQAGVKFYAADCEVVPKIPDLTLAEGTTTSRPSHDYRGYVFLDKYYKSEPNVKLGHTPNDDHVDLADSAMPFFNPHTSNELVPYQKYGKDHPEYYALLPSGKRMQFKNPKNANSYGIHLCLSNPDVQRIATERVLAAIESQKGATFVSVTQGDGRDWCTCDACKALDAIPGDDKTDRLMTFVNAIAREVVKKYPDKVITTIAYLDDTARPPTRVLPEPNVLVYYCPYPYRHKCFSHDFTCERNKQTLEDLRGWFAKCPKQVGLVAYPRGGFPHEPFPSTLAEIKRIEFLEKSGGSGVAFCVVPENFCDLFQFLMGQRLWDKNADVNKLIDEFMAVYYGKAAPAVREYFNMMHRATAAPSIHLTGNNINAPGRFVVTPEFADQALAVFERAEAAVANDPVLRARVEREKLCVLWSVLYRYNKVNKRMAMSEKVFDERLAEVLRIARDRKVYPFHSRPDSSVSKWLETVVGIKVTADPWHTDPQVKRLMAGK